MWNDFKNIQNLPYVFDNYLNYYNALTGWVKKHYDDIGVNLIQMCELDTMLDIDFEKYLSNEPEISLELEKKRIFNNKPSTIDGLLSCINHTIWDMIRLYSGKDCPACKSELHYVIYEGHKTKQKELGFDCSICGLWQQYFDETKDSAEKLSVHPVNTADLEFYMKKYGF
jgi:transposase-like protein